MPKSKRVDIAVMAAARTATAVQRTHSLTYSRLLALALRTPPRVPGAFRFPFGLVRYSDARTLQSMYYDIFVDHVYEVATLGDAANIIDCGGNIGLSTIWFKQRYPRATITVFEADPQIASLLERNIRALHLDAVRIVRAAVSDVAGLVSFTSDGGLSGRIGNGSGIPIQSVRLSEHIDAPVDLLKLDVEGSEFGVVTELCASGRIGLVKAIVCEVHGRGDVQQEFATLWADLSRAGFQLTVSSARALALTDDAIRPPDPTPFTHAASDKFLLLLHAWRPTASHAVIAQRVRNATQRPIGVQ